MTGESIPLRPSPVLIDFYIAPRSWTNRKLDKSPTGISQPTLWSRSGARHSDLKPAEWKRIADWLTGIIKDCEPGLRPTKWVDGLPKLWRLG